MHSNELVICGLAAVKARFQRDSASIKRLFFDYETGRKIGVIAKALAQARKVYRCVTPEELEKIAGTVHHGGVVAVVADPGLRAPLARDLESWAKARTPILLLDRIGNAHNLGALARSAAFFGVEHLVLPMSPVAAVPGEAAHRVAEGGLEQVTVWRVPSLPKLIGDLKALGYDVVGAATRGGKKPVPAADGRPLALVVGNEEHGMAEDVEKACSRLVTIQGRGKVESLNVSVAGAVLLSSLLG